MANKTIPQLPEQTGKTDNDLLAIVDSGETTTSKIKVSTLLDGVAVGNLLESNGTNSFRTPQYATTDTAGDGQLIIGGDGGSSISNTDANSTIIGSRSSNLTDGTDGMIIVGGWVNNLSHTGANSRSGIIAGGYANTVTGKRNFTNGTFNTNSSDQGAVLAGESNNISGTRSAIIAGNNNTMTGGNSVIAGGTSNTVPGDNAAIIGGTNGSNSTPRAVMVGGRDNSIGSEGGEASIMCGGRSNSINTNTYGRYNGIYSSYDSTIRNGGGASYYNSQLLVLGGNNNVIEHTGTYPNMTTVGGNNNVLEDSSRGVIVGGNNTTLSGHTNSVMIGCSGRTSGSDYYTYVESLEAFTHIVLNDYSNLNFASDSAAATGGVPLGGLYHNAGDLKVRIT